jgi:hypothetical protein
VASVGTAQGPQTTLFAAASAGATNIKVGSLNGFHVGERLPIGTGAGVETPIVTAIGTPGTATNLDGAHSAGVAPVGKTMKLAGSAKDPDGDAMSFKWWQYYEADSYAGTIEIARANSPDASFRVPAAAEPGDTIHVIMEVKDGGVPALTRYQRVIVTVAGR